jgi:hypothetical protein
MTANHEAKLTPTTARLLVEAKDQLWQMAHIQDKQEDESAFMVNWLRGTIKIPQCVKDRIYWSEKQRREALSAAERELE